MNVKKYQGIVKRNLKKPNYIKNYITSFLSGGTLGMTAEILYLIFKNIIRFSSLNSALSVTLIMIIISSFLTSIGIFDNLITKFRCGLIIPTTGFAHSITSSALDYKKEGYIKGLGSNFFHLAGSVILYSVVVSFLLIIFKVIINA